MALEMKLILSQTNQNQAFTFLSFVLGLISTHTQVVGSTSSTHEELVTPPPRFTIITFHSILLTGWTSCLLML